MGTRIETPGANARDLRTAAERRIVHENGGHYVYDTRRSYEVRAPHQAGTCIVDSAYRRDAGGLSIAIARCDYLARRN